MDEQLEGQMTIFDFKPDDMTTDRDGRMRKAPDWYNYKRCENCHRWNRLDISEQAPAGWGTKGWCAQHSQRTDLVSFCDSFDDKNRII